MTPQVEALVKTRDFTAEHHDALRTAFDQRNVGDYAFEVPFPEDVAQALLERAEKFVDAAEAYFRQHEGG
jgi:uncharacterized protein (UPF0332 family)